MVEKNAKKKKKNLLLRLFQRVYYGTQWLDPPPPPLNAAYVTTLNSTVGEERVSVFLKGCNNNHQLLLGSF